MEASPLSPRGKQQRGILRRGRWSNGPQVPNKHEALGSPALNPRPLLPAPRAYFLAKPALVGMLFSSAFIRKALHADQQSFLKDRPQLQPNGRELRESLYSLGAGFPFNPHRASTGHQALAKPWEFRDRKTWVNYSMLCAVLEGSSRGRDRGHTLIHSLVLVRQYNRDC